MKYQTINGFTKESMKEVIKKEFKGRAVNIDDRCLYLTDDGKKCAIGCFIPDGHPAQQGWGTASMISKRYVDLKLPLERDGLQKFQSYHDGDSCFYMSTIGEQKEMLCKWIDENVID